MRTEYQPTRNERAMNKAMRHQVKMRKFKKRLVVLNLHKEEGSFHAYITSGKPCSCFMCSPLKYNRAQVKKGARHD